MAFCVVVWSFVAVAVEGDAFSLYVVSFADEVSFFVDDECCVVPFHGVVSEHEEKAVVCVEGGDFHVNNPLPLSSRTTVFIWLKRNETKEIGFIDSTLALASNSIRDIDAFQSSSEGIHV